MKKLFVFAFLTVLAGNALAQGKKPVTFTAEIANRNGDDIFIQDQRGKTLRKIHVNADGVFKDTITLKKDGAYTLYDGTEQTGLYLKNGYDLKLKMNAKEFDESIVYSGTGANENNYLAQNALAEESYNYDDLLASDEAKFAKKLEEKKASDLKKLQMTKLDPDFVTLQKYMIDGATMEISEYYKQNLEKKKLNNTASASFNYENYKGGTTKLEDLKGKYVYIDVWATWCGPCRAEIPHLKKTEEAYHGKNIEFVSISVDVAKDHEKWKTFVKDKELGGMQLFADKDWNSDFIKSYGIDSIPRFILIGPDGKIVNADAPRPSSPQLKTDLDALLK
jgi:thiol-disulfide isomerase/thioredoxin